MFLIGTGTRGFFSTYCTAVYEMGKLLQQDKQCMYKPNSEGCSRNRLCRRKVICVTYSDCVSVALFIQHANRVCYVILSAVACLAVPYFLHVISYKERSSEEVAEHKMYVLIFSTNSS